MVADALAPIWCQGICNHHDDSHILSYQMLWNIIFGSPVMAQAAWLLLMPWHLHGARRSATIMLAWYGHCQLSFYPEFFLYSVKNWVMMINCQEIPWSITGPLPGKPAEQGEWWWVTKSPFVNFYVMDLQCITKSYVTFFKPYSYFRCHYSSVVVTPVQYEIDIQKVTECHSS